tara:strand:+ start:132 stop:743 length:612 start_codon:yes stop_codon:yes gene_type:complete
MKEYEIDYGSFIGGWYIPEDVCDDVIDLYNSEKENWIDGECGHNEVNYNYKKSTEMHINPPDYSKKLSTYLPQLSNCLNAYRQKYPYCDSVDVYNLLGTNIKIQHYKPGEGFYEWHHENDGRTTINRHLVFMTYLNTLDNGGTDFFHQKITTPCHKGLTVIWPAHWTHVHKGVTNYVSDKYIITGWYSFNAIEFRVDTPSRGI